MGMQAAQFRALIPLKSSESEAKSRVFEVITRARESIVSRTRSGTKRIVFERIDGLQMVTIRGHQMVTIQNW